MEEDEVPQKGADLFRAGDLEPEEDFGWEEYTPVSVIFSLSCFYVVHANEFSADGPSHTGQ